MLNSENLERVEESAAPPKPPDYWMPTRLPVLAAYFFFLGAEFMFPMNSIAHNLAFAVTMLLAGTFWGRILERYDQRKLRGGGR